MATSEDLDRWDSEANGQVLWQLVPALVVQEAPLLVVSR